MFRLRIGYLISGIITGVVLLFTFITTLPDGKLHLVFCDVGQGDALYIKFPDGRDGLIDGGPNNQVLACLGRHMPFWDRNIDLVILTHPQKDHLSGLVAVFSRYKIETFVKSDLSATDEIYQELMNLVNQKHIPVRLATSGNKIATGPVNLDILWPSDRQIALMGGNVLGATTKIDVNNGSVVTHLAYGQFDAYFPGDAGNNIYSSVSTSDIGADPVEILKVPHHGSKTGLNQGLIDWLRPQVAVISVGRNTFGHPTKEILDLLSTNSIKVYRTDKDGDIEVISDGINWKINSTSGVD